MKRRNHLQSANVQAQHLIPLRITIEHIQKTGYDHHRNHEDLESRIHQFLQRVELAQNRLFGRMRSIAEDSQDIVFRLCAQIFPRRQILPPFARRKMPEDRKHDQDQETDGGSVMIPYCLVVSKKVDRAVNLKSRYAKKDDECRLYPVPESFKCLIDIFFFHIISDPFSSGL